MIVLQATNNFICLPVLFILILGLLLSDDDKKEVCFTRDCFLLAVLVELGKLSSGNCYLQPLDLEEILF